MLTLLMLGLLLASGSFDWVKSSDEPIAANHRLEHQLGDSVSKAAFRHLLTLVAQQKQTKRWRI